MSKGDQEDRPQRDGSPTGCTSDPDDTACAMAGNPVLLAQGWERRNIADQRMAREAADLYSQMGFEVRTEPLSAQNLPQQCVGCSPLLQRFVVVYTRSKRDG